MKCIYLVCATGIATSTMLRVKVEDFLEQKGIEAEVQQYRVAEMVPGRITADVILATTEMPPDVEERFKVINGMPLLTGVGEEQVFEELEKILMAD